MAELTEDDVATIKGMLKRGDRHMDVATLFGINQARVSEIKLGKRSGAKFRHVVPRTEELPLPGPYVVVARTAHDEMQAKALAHQRLVAMLEGLLAEVRASV